MLNGFFLLLCCIKMCKIFNNCGNQTPKPAKTEKNLCITHNVNVATFCISFINILPTDDVRLPFSI